MSNLSLGKEIRSRRAALKLSQNDLAEMAGTTPRTVFDIETGRGNPSFKTILGVLDILGLDIQIMIKKPH